MSLDEFKGIIVNRRRAAEAKLYSYDNAEPWRRDNSREFLVGQLSVWRDIASMVKEVK